MADYANLEDANEYIQDRYPNIDVLSEADLRAASFDVDTMVDGKISVTTGLKLDPTDTEWTDHQIICLLRATSEQAVYRREMNIMGHSFQIRDELEDVRGADGSARKRARAKFSPSGRYWLNQSGIEAVIGVIGTSETGIGSLQVGGF